MHTKTALLAAALSVVVAGCGSSSSSSSNSGSASTTAAKPATTSSTAVNPNAKEKPPPGDIPDSTAFVRFKLPQGGFSMTVPEGWSRTSNRGRTTFTSNLNSVTVETRPAHGTVTVASAKSTDVPALARSLKNFKLQSVATINRAGQKAVRIGYLAAGPQNAVTGRAVTDYVERYLLVHNGKEAVITLAGPKGADNVDAWRTMSNSVRWSA